MKDKFKPGDVVELKSGGARMTVCEVSPTAGFVWVNFFDPDGTFRSMSMNPDTLTVASNPSTVERTTAP